MINYLGIKKYGKMPHLILGAGEKVVEIPVDEPTADRINKYLEKIIMVGGSELMSEGEDLEDGS